MFLARLKSFAHLIVFVIATYSLTEFFTAYKFFQNGQESHGYWVIYLNIFLFVISMIYLSFSMYAEEKTKGNLRVTFSPFEILYKKLRSENL